MKSTPFFYPEAIVLVYIYDNEGIATYDLYKKVNADFPMSTATFYDAKKFLIQEGFIEEKQEKGEKKIYLTEKGKLFAISLKPGIETYKRMKKEADPNKILIAMALAGQTILIPYVEMFTRLGILDEEAKKRIIDDLKYLQRFLKS